MRNPIQNFKTLKQRGEWVEMRFMARAAEEGLHVSKPWGESTAYDFIVEHHSRCLRVQVKSTMMRRDNGYICHLVGSNRIPYAQGAFDFAAVYIIFSDVGSSRRNAYKMQSFLGRVSKNRKTTSTKRHGTFCARKHHPHRRIPS